MALAELVLDAVKTLLLLNAAVSMLPANKYCLVSLLVCSWVYGMQASKLVCKR